MSLPKLRFIYTDKFIEVIPHLLVFHRLFSQVVSKTLRTLFYAFDSFSPLKYLDFLRTSSLTISYSSPPCTHLSSTLLCSDHRETSSECVDCVWPTHSSPTFIFQNWLGYTKKRAPIGFHRVVEILHKNSAPVQVTAPKEK